MFGAEDFLLWMRVVKSTGGAIKGRLLDIDDTGGIKVSRKGKHKTAPLTWMLAGPSWSLD